MVRIGETSPITPLMTIFRFTRRTGSFSDRDSDYDLYIMNADGTNLRKLTGDEIDEVGWYAWSPDGSRIVYDSRTDVRGVHDLSECNDPYCRMNCNDFADQFASWTLDGRSVLVVNWQGWKQ